MRAHRVYPRRCIGSGLRPNLKRIQSTLLVARRKRYNRCLELHSLFMIQSYFATKLERKRRAATAKLRGWDLSALWHSRARDATRTAMRRQPLTRPTQVQKMQKLIVALALSGAAARRYRAQSAPLRVNAEEETAVLEPAAVPAPAAPAKKTAPATARTRSPSQPLAASPRPPAVHDKFFARPCARLTGRFSTPPGLAYEQNPIAATDPLGFLLGSPSTSRTRRPPISAPGRAQARPAGMAGFVGYLVHAKGITGRRLPLYSYYRLVEGFAATASIACSPGGLQDDARRRRLADARRAACRALQRSRGRQVADHRGHRLPRVVRRVAVRQPGGGDARHGRCPRTRRAPAGICVEINRRGHGEVARWRTPAPSSRRNHTGTTREPPRHRADKVNATTPRGWRKPTPE